MPMPPTIEEPEDWQSLYPKSSSMAIMLLPEEIELNEYGEIPTWEKIKIRTKEFVNNPSQAWDHTKETFWNTHGDVLKERLGEFEGREAMGDSLDNEHNSKWNILYNKWHKEKLREAFDELGKPRKH
jgi:hypothetical protein